MIQNRLDRSQETMEAADAAQAAAISVQELKTRIGTLLVLSTVSVTVGGQAISGSVLNALVDQNMTTASVVIAGQVITGRVVGYGQ